jgi:hypothetical protein
MTRLATYNTRAKAKFLDAARPQHVLDAPVALMAAECLWVTSLMPEGCLERWRVTDGARIHLGQVLAELRIEGALHEIVAPVAGHSVVEPGALLGNLQPDRAAAA